MERTEWLNNLKAGDMVAIEDRSVFHTILPIKRITNTQLICAKKNFSGEYYDLKFKKSNGYLIGQSSWSITSIVPVTEEIVTNNKKIILYRKINKIFETTPNVTFDITALESVWEMVKKYYKEQ